MIRRFLGLVSLAFVAFFGMPDEAFAYPQYIAHGYASCGSCHYSPDGGGLLNAYGVAVTQALLPDEIDVGFLSSLRETLQKKIVTGENDNGDSAFHWDVGLESRYLLVQAVTDIGEEKEFFFIPMLFEAQGVMAWGNWTFYGSATPKKVGTTTADYYVHSRHHWLQYRHSDELSVRVGKLALPFGTRTPDHTVYTRQRLGFDKYSQSYGLQLDWTSENWSMAGMGFAGESPWQNWGMQEKGATGTVAYLLPARAAIGLSLLYGTTAYHQRLVSGVFTRIKGFAKSYLLLEADYQRKFNDSEAQAEIITYARLGWFIREWFDLYGEFQRVHLLSHPGTMNRPPHEMAFNIGSNLQILPWMEMVPGVRITEQDTGYDLAAMFQVHIIY